MPAYHTYMRRWDITKNNVHNQNCYVKQHFLFWIAHKFVELFSNCNSLVWFSFIIGSNFQQHNCTLIEHFQRMYIYIYIYNRWHGAPGSMPKLCAFWNAYNDWRMNNSQTTLNPFCGCSIVAMCSLIRFSSKLWLYFATV